jgi:hypothetical protein
MKKFSFILGFLVAAVVAIICILIMTFGSLPTGEFAICTLIALVTIACAILFFYHAFILFKEEKVLDLAEQEQIIFDAEYHQRMLEVEAQINI